MVTCSRRAGLTETTAPERVAVLPPVVGSLVGER